MFAIKYTEWINKYKKKKQKKMNKSLMNSLINWLSLTDRIYKFNEIQHFWEQNSWYKTKDKGMSLSRRRMKSNKDE